MKRFFSLFTFCFVAVFALQAQNWDAVCNSGEYYYGEGVADNEADADNAALSSLSSMIAVHVTSSTDKKVNQVNLNTDIDYKEYFTMSMKSYTQALLVNCEKQVLNKKSQVVVHRWMKRSELATIFKDRINKAKTFVKYGDDYLARNSAGMALQYYYWAYALISSVQYPNEVMSDSGEELIASLPKKMKDILDDIKIDFRDREGDDLELLFTYRGKAVASELYFTFNDGRDQCTGRAKDGVGFVEMIPGFAGEYCHIDVDYACRNRSTDQELASVLSFACVPTFSNAEHKVKVQKASAAPRQETPLYDMASATHRTSSLPGQAEAPGCITGVQLNPTATQTVQDAHPYEATMQRIIKAISQRRYTEVMDCFTLDGLEIFNRLIDYGQGRIVGTPNLHYFKSYNNTVVVRGLQMAFTFKRGTKTNFVEDIAFSFDASGKIYNVAFGLGNNVENDILTKKADGWTELAREIVMEFLENYKTAYSLERLDYLRTLFSDDALIIVGNVLRVHTSANGAGHSAKAEKIIRYNRYTKDEYIKHLSHCFNRNDFINIRFTQCDVQPLEKFEGEVYGIQLGQDYQSSTYSDFGYLFLMVNMTDPDQPLIKIRTWQEKPDPNFGWYNAGDFYEK